MPEYPVRVPRSDDQRDVANSIEAYINMRFDSFTAERMTFSYAVIAAELDIPIDTIRDMLAPIEGGDAALMVWRNARRRRRGQTT